MVKKAERTFESLDELIWYCQSVRILEDHAQTLLSEVASLHKKLTSIFRTPTQLTLLPLMVFTNTALRENN